ncbi:hypothetical protein RhiXN_09339 [Rhizoctonia solani]|uniref:Uncharacterized protein n=1 Tax=Rhizoctonia solani TaxID=456999 RepID=A0A8H8SWB0_9AGAM|nr:uncharacterized protein RhiXN_09339 [Rhizoctonia solani]QRW20364.1 hypothetical protein RhiXN_09339 [Rhizoctonia solani]
MARVIQRPMAILFFRRVRPVETRIYAFTRNSFAVAAIVVLIFQLVTALRQAQTKLELGQRQKHVQRLLQSTADGLSDRDRVRWDLLREDATQDDINITISAILNNPNKPYRPYTMTSCNVTWVDSYSIGFENGTAHKVSELFNCPSSLINPVDGLAYSLSMSPSEGHIIEKELSYIYRVQLHLAGKVPGGRIYETQLPRIWFVNAWEFRELNWSDATQVKELTRVRKYSLPLVLVPGSQIRSQASLITRRFITSSIVREILFNSEPVRNTPSASYVNLLTFGLRFMNIYLYPVAQLSGTPLDDSDARVATADIQITLNPGHMQYRTRLDPENRPFNLREDVCDFIEDYRSGTVLDVIGSVGGLFALLQAAHLLLFGRPLFWGLVGAKTISPFGLLGRCSSRNFKRRLREEYHTQSDEESAHTIQIVKFLRDFVIDFGPADLESVADRPHESRALSVMAESDAGDENEPDSEIPLIPLAGRSHDTPIHSGVAQSPKPELH